MTLPFVSFVCRYPFAIFPNSRDFHPPPFRGTKNKGRRIGVASLLLLFARAEIFVAAVSGAPGGNRRKGIRKKARDYSGLIEFEIDRARERKAAEYDGLGLEARRNRSIEDS